VSRRFATTDVFAERAFGGNPLAVVLDAAGLSDAEMQAIAREFDYSETTFVLPPDDPAHTARVRIFTPAQEIPFAGHPNVGTAYVLARLRHAHGPAAGDRLLFEERAGLVPVDVAYEAGRPVGATLTAPEPLAVGATVPAATVAACAGLAPADIDTRRHPPTVVSGGLPFPVAEVRDRAALARARPVPEAFAALPAAAGGSLHLYTRDAGDLDLRTRMFAPPHGIPEDAATGSANAALAAYLASLATEADLHLRLRIGQGDEMGRPSRLVADVEKAAGRVGAVRIGGRCVLVADGVLHVPAATGAGA
jgi:trans-2,3-dihydro-3-hydroxyanthranilate isomerase